VSKIRYRFRKQLVKLQPICTPLFALSYIVTDRGLKPP